MTAALDPALFRSLFPEFADAATYPDALLSVRWTQATGYINPDQGCDGMSDGATAEAVQLMMAHQMRLAKAQAAGTGSAGVVTAASIDKVTVTLAPPPTRDAWGYWLAQTPYGQQLSALLSSQAAGGFYAGGAPERSAFRRVGGVFG